jgi:hypothetical protein
MLVKNDEGFMVGNQRSDSNDLLVCEVEDHPTLTVVKCDTFEPVIPVKVTMFA